MAVVTVGSAPAVVVVVSTVSVSVRPLLVSEVALMVRSPPAAIWAWRLVRAPVSITRSPPACSRAGAGLSPVTCSALVTTVVVVSPSVVCSVVVSVSTVTVRRSLLSAAVLRVRSPVTATMRPEVLVSAPARAPVSPSMVRSVSATTRPLLVKVPSSR